MDATITLFKNKIKVPSHSLALQSDYQSPETKSDVPFKSQLPKTRPIIQLFVFVGCKTRLGPFPFHPGNRNSGFSHSSASNTCVPPDTLPTAPSGDRFLCEMMIRAPGQLLHHLPHSPGSFPLCSVCSILKKGSKMQESPCELLLSLLIEGWETPGGIPPG